MLNYISALNASEEKRQIAQRFIGDLKKDNFALFKQRIAKKGSLYNFVHTVDFDNTYHEWLNITDSLARDEKEYWEKISEMCMINIDRIDISNSIEKSKGASKSKPLEGDELLTAGFNLKELEQKFSEQKLEFHSSFQFHKQQYRGFLAILEKMFVELSAIDLNLNELDYPITENGNLPKSNNVLNKAVSVVAGVQAKKKIAGATGHYKLWIYIDERRAARTLQTEETKMPRKYVEKKPATIYLFKKIKEVLAEPSVAQYQRNSFIECFKTFKKDNQADKRSPVKLTAEDMLPNKYSIKDMGRWLHLNNVLTDDEAIKLYTAIHRAGKLV